MHSDERNIKVPISFNETAYHQRVLIASPQSEPPGFPDTVALWKWTHSLAGAPFAAFHAARDGEDYHSSSERDSGKWTGDQPTARLHTLRKFDLKAFKFGCLTRRRRVWAVGYDYQSFSNVSCMIETMPFHSPRDQNLFNYSVEAHATGHLTKVIVPRHGYQNIDIVRFAIRPDKLFESVGYVAGIERMFVLDEVEVDFHFD
ncbi:hypothetical protein K402DRAFT_397703 [Aulographum hederae CBS 113979]|uniref:Uncharacterized protein n=1 Tax=Aulographum hederae CBS 113979 TaxID=1176131 RepID=A0A6G1GMS5_9PEZI|nr:hypothetical protein K402DRAFT_397703 [Aulographum hederae CBS 113979]